MSTTVTINKGTYSYPTNGDSQWGTSATNVMKVVAQNTTVDESRTVYVGDHGSDSNTVAPTIGKAFLTFGKAMTFIGTQANTNNRWTVICLTNKAYTETFTIPQYVTVYAVSADLSGCTITNNGALYELRDIKNDADSALPNSMATSKLLGRTTAGTGAVEQISAGGAGTGLLLVSGGLSVDTSYVQKLSDKATDFSVIDDTKYPTTEAVSEYVAANAGAGANLLINGNFDVWQRGTILGAASQTAYLADHVNNVAIFSSTISCEQSAFTLGTATPANAKYYQTNVVVTGSAANSASFIDLTIEDVIKLAGKQVTFSFYAKANATKSISIEFIQNFGTGGSPSAEVTSQGVSKKSITTSWVRYTATVTLGSISGKTLGTTANTSFTRVRIWYDAGSDYNARTSTLGNQSGTFDIAQCKLEIGSSATNWVTESYEEVINACKRYYHILNLSEKYFAEQYGTPRVSYSFQTMRVNPTIDTTGLTYNVGSLNAATALSVDAIVLASDDSTGTNIIDYSGTVLLDAEF